MNRDPHDADCGISDNISNYLAGPKSHAPLGSRGSKRPATDTMSGIGAIDDNAARNFGITVEDVERPSNPSKPTATKHYGGSRKPMISAADKKDRIIDLEKENNVLKEKENLLNQEV